MLELTFGEQVKIVLSRKGMTIKELAELIEERTGKKMSRQNLTQRLSRDNFQEQDMRMIAAILECPLHLSILDDNLPIERPNKTEEPKKKAPQEAEPEEVRVSENERDITIGELIDINEELDAMIAEEQEEILPQEPSVEELLKEVDELEAESREMKKAGKEAEEKTHGWKSYLQRRKKKEEAEEVHTESGEVVGDVNPYTGKEYESNSVRMHPNRIGYVQVYDREEHRWTDMTEWAFLGYQERKKALLGKDYEPPIYLD